MLNLQYRLYETAYIFYQNVWTSWRGYLEAYTRYGSLYYSLLLKLEKYQHLNEYCAKKYQEQELQRILHYVVEKSPFYREFYRSINIKNIKTIEDLKTLPILKEELMLQNIQDVYTVSTNATAKSMESGKKVGSLKLMQTKKDVQKNKAFLDFFKKQHGAVNLEMKRASFSSWPVIPTNRYTKVFWRDNFFINQRIYSSYNCTQENASVYLENLEKYRPEFIDGLPSAIYELAKFINRNKVILTVKPVAIFSVGEEVYPHIKKEIEEAFGCPVRDRYSLAGAAPFVMECVEGKMHYNLYSGIIEISEEGNMIVTSFNNYGTPFIRYDTGDRVELPKEHTICKCGSVHPVFEKIQTNYHRQARTVKYGKSTIDFYSETLGNFPGTLNKYELFTNAGL